MVDMSTLNDAVAATVRAERAAAGLTQEQIATATGMNVQTVMRIERGIRSATMVQLASIAAALGMSPSELVKRAEERLARN